MFVASFSLLLSQIFLNSFLLKETVSLNEAAAAFSGGFSHVSFAINCVSIKTCPHPCCTKPAVLDFLFLAVLRDQRYKLLHYSREELSIQLSNLSHQDEGVYRCLLYTRHVRTKSHRVQVLAAPSHPVLEICRDEERGIRLSCHSQGGRPQPQISWMLDNGMELPGDTRHELGADGQKWSSRSSLRILSYSPAVTATATATATCVLRHPALGPRGLRASFPFQDLRASFPSQDLRASFPFQDLRASFPSQDLRASFPFQDLPRSGCKQVTRPSEDGEVPSPSENPAGSSTSASSNDPGVSSSSASPENPEASSPSASPNDPGVPSPSASPNDPGVPSPSASPENPEISSPSASLENPEVPSPSASPKDPEVSSPSASPNDPGVSSPSASPENPEFSSPSESPKDPEVSIPSASPGIPAVPSSAPAQPNPTDVTRNEQNPQSKGLLRKEKNLLLPILVAALLLVLLVIVLLFLVKLKKAHGVWKRENDVSEQTLESYKSRSNEDSPGHEKNGQAGNPKCNMQYVTEGHMETPEKNLETPEKNPESPKKSPGDQSPAINEEMFRCGRETDV
ncbi:cytotoxic and regulatory T-cell molecule [Geothlypis trichas]